MDTNRFVTCQEARTEGEDTQPKELNQTQETVKINAQKQHVRDGEAHSNEKEPET